MCIPLFKKMMQYWQKKSQPWWIFAKTQFETRLVFPGGAEQEVSTARPPDPAERGNLHLHQRPNRVHEAPADAGSVRHHPHHLPASGTGGLYAAGFH